MCCKKGKGVCCLRNLGFERSRRVCTGIYMLCTTRICETRDESTAYDCGVSAALR